MIDYEHQTLFTAMNGKPNPAAGWMEKAEYISGEGVFVDVKWTKKAHQQIQDGEYRYISPMFLSDQDGKVTKVINAALTNSPACHDLAEAIAFSSQFEQSHKHKKDNSMLELLRQLFGEPNATEDQIKEKLSALSATKGDSQVALSDVYTKLKEKEGEVVALTAKSGAEPDPSKYVPISMMKDVQDKLNALNGVDETAGELMTKTLQALTGFVINERTKPLTRSSTALKVEYIDGWGYYPYVFNVEFVMPRLK